MKNCEWTRDHLDDYVDGELIAIDARNVESHVQECANCRESLESLQGLLREAAALPKRVQPESDLWPEVASQLESGSVIRWRRHARTAVYAAAIAAMTVVAVSLGLLQTPQISDPPAPVADSRSIDLQEPLETDRSELRQAYLVRAEALDPVLRSVIDSNLTIIDDSLVELRAAMRLSPDNPRLEQMYMTACVSEVEMLRQVVQLGPEG